MKHLKTFEEISPEYIQGKIAGKPGGKRPAPFDYSFVNSEGVHA